MEDLLNLFGQHLVWAVAFTMIPLAGVGLWLRRNGRRRAADADLRILARRKAGDIQPGVVTVDGCWLGDGMVDLDGGAVRVVGHTATLKAGTRVVVSGVATHDEADPRPGSYRNGGRAWVVDVSDGIVAPESALEHSRRRGRTRSVVGAALFALAIAATATAAAVAHRADHTAYFEPEE
jgi:hypothetical protein